MLHVAIVSLNTDAILLCFRYLLSQKRFTLPLQRSSEGLLGILALDDSYLLGFRSVLSHRLVALYLLNTENERSSKSGFA